LYADGAVDARAFKAVDSERCGALGEGKFTCITFDRKGGERQSGGCNLHGSGLACEVMKGEAAQRVGMHALALAKQLDFGQGLALVIEDLAFEGSGRVGAQEGAGPLQSKRHVRVAAQGPLPGRAGEHEVKLWEPRLGKVAAVCSLSAKR